MEEARKISRKDFIKYLIGVFFTFVFTLKIPSFSLSCNRSLNEDYNDFMY